ncbi:MAG: T9SS type A sorting domain-containing protein [Bacteroidetes bacterium]|nr:T9SS type A sorting domain-containing protein [Bacteroidota bacterium]
MAVYRKGGVVTSTEDDAPGTPGEITLLQNYPNPFNPTTTISFSLTHQTFVSLRVFDVLGRPVATVVSEIMPAGTHARRWNAEALAAGIYICRLQTGAFSQSHMMLIIK